MAEDGDGHKDLARRIGGQLKLLRESRGISRQRAAAAIGVSVQTYGNRESGLTELPVHEMVVLAELLQVDVGDLFAEAGDVVSHTLAESTTLQLAAEAETFLRLLHRLPDERLRRDIADAVKAIARADMEEI